MDRNSVIGFALIAAILIGFSLLNPETPESTKSRTEQSASKSEQSVDLDSNNVENELATAQSQSKIDTLYDKDGNVVGFSNPTDTVTSPTKQLNPQLGIFGEAEFGEASYHLLENNKLAISINSKGARIANVKLKEFQAYSDFTDSSEAFVPIQLFDEDSSTQALKAYLRGAGLLNTEELFFELIAERTNTSVSENNPATATFRLATNDPEKYIDFVYTLHQGSYDVEYNLDFVGLEQVIDSRSLTLDWQMKGLSTEKDMKQQRMICGVFYKEKGDSWDYLSEASEDELNIENKTEWVAFKHNYFSSIILYEEGFQKGSKIKTEPLTSSKYTDNYEAKLDISTALTSRTTIPIKFFFGPNDYELMASYENEMDGILNLGWGIFRWVNQILIIPIFNVLNSTGMSYGLLILLLTLVIKIIISPLMYKNYLSSAKMRVLKPEVDKIAAKYKDGNNLKKQQETMALYSKAGASPMAGCLPMLVQMPIVFAAFKFFPASIDMRQKSFLWAEDLSAYDEILSWSAEIPLLSSFYGQHMSLFTILMCGSTLAYTMMTSSQMQAQQQPGMPNMKVIMYFFPIMMLFFLNSFASGLTFYYLCGNVMNIGMMWGIKKFIIDEDKLKAQLHANMKNPKKKKKSGFAARLEEMQKQQMKKMQQQRK